MVSKTDYEAAFNEVLGLDIKWSKLSKEELAQLAVIFNYPEILAEKLGFEVTVSKTSSAMRRKFIDGLFTGLVEKVESYDGPIVSKLREVLEKNPK